VASEKIASDEQNAWVCKYAKMEQMRDGGRRKAKEIM
jgi:hypothetical protein